MGNVDEHSVFLNVPFDSGFERLFVSLVAALIAIGRTPRCVLEIPERGQGRLSRIQELIEACRVSIHDLSRVGTPARFNMPFELGLACSLAKLRGNHDFIILEKVPYRLDKTLSDIKGRDPLIHKGSPKGVVNCVLEALGSPSGDPDPVEVYRMSKTLWKVAKEFKKSTHRNTLFTRTIFHKLVAAAVELSLEKQLLDQ
jgi:hypothetical protein